MDLIRTFLMSASMHILRTNRSLISKLIQTTDCIIIHWRTSAWSLLTSLILRILTSQNTFSLFWLNATTIKMWTIKLFKTRRQTKIIMFIIWDNLIWKNRIGWILLYLSKTRILKSFLNLEIHNLVLFFFHG